MRFTEHELTMALHGAAKQVLASQRKDVRGGRVDVDTAWKELGRYERFELLQGLGAQILPVLTALPDVEVAPGTRPFFTDAQVTEVVQAQLEAGGGRLRRKATMLGRVALVRAALAHLPPRINPDALIVPEHL